VLLIKLPKAESAKPKKIKVSGGGDVSSGGWNGSRPL